MLNYNPQKVASYEIGWWQAHHHGQKLKLVYYLIRQMAKMYDLNLWQAIQVIKPLLPAAKAHNYQHKDEAKKFITQYYTVLKKYTSYKYQPAEVAEKEVAWWWLHDDLEDDQDKTQLINAFAELYAVMLSTNVDKTRLMGEYRAQATHFHDLAEKKSASAEQVAKSWKQATESLNLFNQEFLKLNNILFK